MRRYVKLALFDVIKEDVNKVVPILSTLLVVETQNVHHFVDSGSGALHAALRQRHALSPSLHPNVT
jgi:hypothetical protein